MIEAVSAYSERTARPSWPRGSRASQLQLARGLGAALGQGFLLGHPTDLPSPLPEAGAPVTIAAPPPPGRELTPLGVVAEHRPLRHGSGELLLSIARSLEDQVGAHDGAGVLLSAFQAAGRTYSGYTAQRYADLAEQAAFVGVLGVGMEGRRHRRLWQASIPDDDPMGGEWDVVVIGPATHARSLRGCSWKAPRRRHGSSSSR